jgi:hypothetical protein
MRRRTSALLAYVPHKPRHRVRVLARVLPVQDPSLTQAQMAVLAYSGRSAAARRRLAHRRPFHAAAARPKEP